MNKTSRLTLIKNFVESKKNLGLISTPPASSDVEEEKKLAVAIDNDDEIIGEDEKPVGVSKALAGAVGVAKSKKTQERDFFLTEQERAELGKKPLTVFKFSDLETE